MRLELKSLTKTDQQYVLKWAKKIKAIKLLGGACVECGCEDVFCLEFHHISSKEYGIRELINRRWSVIERELKKCILLCGNCHDEKHYTGTSQNAKIKERLLKIKGVFQCEKCKYRGETAGSLQFHHCSEQPKEFEIHEATTSKINVSWETILLETEKCQVLCSNCHARETMNIKKFREFELQIKQRVATHKELPKPVNRDSVKKMLADGLKQIDIARELGCAKSTISEIVSGKH